MKLEYQVCSLELAKRLKELGVKQDGIFEYRNSYCGTYYTLKPKHKYKIAFSVSAFTGAELGQMLPKEIYENVLVITFNGTRAWEVGYQDKKYFQWLYVENAGTEADAMALMLIYLVEKGIVKP